MQDFVVAAIGFLVALLAAYMLFLWPWPFSRKTDCAWAWNGPLSTAMHKLYKLGGPGQSPVPPIPKDLMVKVQVSTNTSPKCCATLEALVEDDKREGMKEHFQSDLENIYFACKDDLRQGTFNFAVAREGVIDSLHVDTNPATCKDPCVVPVPLPGLGEHVIGTLCGFSSACCAKGAIRDHGACYRDIVEPQAMVTGDMAWMQGQA